MACGPFLPDSVLRGEVPSIEARDWLHAVPMPNEPWVRPRPGLTVDAERADATTALQARGVPIHRHVLVLNAYDAYVRGEDGVPFPTDLPDEFRRYREAVDALAHEKDADAVAGLRALLALPARERHWRGTWAAYMLGNLENNAGRTQEAIAAWQQVRELARGGSADTLGLAFASLRQEGPAHGLEALELQIGLCARYEAGGGKVPTCAPWRSLAQAALLAPEDVQERVLRDPLARSVVNAALAEGGRYFWNTLPDDRLVQVGWADASLDWARERWLAASERVGVTGASGADLLAYAAYNGGNYDQAERWVARADRRSPMTAWVRIRLARRKGDATSIVRAYKDVDPAKASTALHLEMGRIFLEQGRGVEAVQAFLLGASWIDAAYVAERILTVNELRRLIPRVPGPSVSPPPDRDAWTYHMGGYTIEEVAPDAEPRHAGDGFRAPRAALGHLLARRLVREGRWKEAVPYFPQDVRATAERAARLVTTRSQVTGELRGERTAELAYLLRHYGMDLQGTELAPDWHLFEGDYETDDLEARRRERDVTAYEARRLAAHPVPTERFHYRRAAAELAWTASLDFGDGDPRLSQILCQSGRWMADRDPTYADRFYKALVRRGRGEEVATYADRKRWFPEIDDQYRCASWGPGRGDLDEEAPPEPAAAAILPDDNDDNDDERMPWWAILGTVGGVGALVAGVRWLRDLTNEDTD